MSKFIHDLLNSNPSIYTRATRKVVFYAALSMSLLCIFTLTPVPTYAQQADVPVSEQVEDLKQALITLNRDLFILEEDLLFPSSTQVTVFLSLDVGHYFQLDAVELKIDDQTVTHYLYTEKQRSALARGGVQRLYMGNLAQGTHEITAFFIGIGPENRPYKRAVSLNFDKDDEPASVELSIADSASKQQPEFIASVL